MCLSPSNQIGLNCLHSSFYVVSRAICKPGLQLLFKRGRFKKKKKSAMFGSSKVQQFDVMSAITAVFVFLLLLLILMEDKHSLLFQSV